MDWPTVRVLTNNLRELFDQMKTGAHIAERQAGKSTFEDPPSVKENWRVGILTASASLRAELGLKEEEHSIHHSWKSFLWPESEKFKLNPYIRMARATLAVAEKLLRDYDAEIQKEKPNKKVEPTS